MNFVIDTNIIISALILRKGTPYKAVVKALKNNKILLSQEVLDELGNVLSREKFKKYVFDFEDLFSALLENSQFIEVTETIIECRDPNDNKFLELAVCGQAACIISGDKDLLVLHPFRNIPILSANDFLNNDDFQ